MTKDGGRRIAIPKGAMLADPIRLGNVTQSAAEALFEPAFWQSRGQLYATGRGRGAAWFIADGARQWVLRHFRRGGFVARLCADRYLWTGEARVRAFAEWRLLAALAAMDLPVPRPVAARYRRRWLTYRCDLITERLQGARPLSAILEETRLSEQGWRAVGAALARLHRAGVDHADLNAHNILLDAAGAASVIDFDRGRVRPPGRWRRANLRRLHRSLVKIATGMPPDRFSPTDWDCLIGGYGSA